jgi:hypothetical protein
MSTGVQFTGTLAAGASQRWFTFNWPTTWHVVWYMMPTTVGTAPELNWSVAVERTDATHATYWITVTNLTSAPVSFEARYAVL